MDTTARFFAHDGVVYSARFIPDEEYGSARAYVWPLGERGLDISLRGRILEEALRAMGLSEEAWSKSYSPTAGCECGCSPGFVLYGVPGRRGLYVEAEGLL